MLVQAMRTELPVVQDLGVALHTLEAVCREPSAAGFVINSLGIFPERQRQLENIFEGFAPTLAAHGFKPHAHSTFELDRPSGLDIVPPDTVQVALCTGGLAVGYLIRYKEAFQGDWPLGNFDAEVPSGWLESDFFYPKITRCTIREDDLLVCPPGRVMYMRSLEQPFSLQFLTSRKSEP